MWREPDPPEALTVIEEHPPGDAPESWWVVYGNATPDVGVFVTLEDGTHPTVHRIGHVWACEWVSPPQNAYLYRSDRPKERQPWRIRMIRPGYLPAP